MPQTIFDELAETVALTGTLRLTRRSDGAELGKVELMGKDIPATYLASRYLEATSLAVETLRSTDPAAVLRWVVDNPHLTDPTKGDPNLVFFADRLMRVVKRVAGGGILATIEDSDDTFVYAYRDAAMQGWMYQARDGWYLINLHRAGDQRLYPSYDDALEALGDLSLGPEPSGHDRMLREQQKAEDRARRAGSGRQDKGRR